jgi:hypothetical protein
MTDLPLTDGCNCGAVRFEVTERLDVRDWLLAERKNCRLGGFMELAGLEPATSWVRSRRSPN